MSTAVLARQQQAQAATDDAGILIGRIRAAWPWLAEAAIPGPAQPPPGRYLTVDAENRAGRRHRFDRESMLAAADAGRMGSGAHPDAARVEPIAARAYIADRIRRLAEHLHAREHPGETMVWPFGNPRMRHVWQPCWRCDGAGTCIASPGYDRKTGLGLPLTMQVCPDCHGEARLLAGNPCSVCHAVGPCGCDIDDAHVEWGLAFIMHTVKTGGLRLHVAAKIRTVLSKCDNAARRAAQTGEHNVVRLAAPCPACGRRELVADVAAPRREEWTVRCASLLCLCRGSGCPCRRPTRTEGGRHLWPAAHWDSDAGLAARLGVSRTRPEAPE